MNVRFWSMFLIIHAPVSLTSNIWESFYVYDITICNWRLGSGSANPSFALVTITFEKTKFA